MIEFCQENALVIKKKKKILFFNNTTDNFTHGHHQMVNTEIKMITFFVAEDGEAIHNQQKQDWELTMSQITNLR